MAIDDPADWRYKGEGASNVVLDYHGSAPELIGKVLRIRKMQDGSDAVLSDAERSLWAPWPSVSSATDEEEMRHVFVRDVVAPLLGDEYVDPGVVAPVSREFLLSVAENIREKRPAWRAKEADLDFSSRNVLVVCDHTQLINSPGTLSEEYATVSMEIKPKWGYLPTSQAIAPRNDIKQHVSRFTMHQQLKLSQGKIKEISPYCPLDLFSGTRDGIRKALKALFKCPQNNLRLFINGDRIFTGSSDGAPDSTNDAASLDSLERSLVKIIGGDHGNRLGLLQDLVTELLYTTGALKRLLRAQKDDELDIEGMIHVFYSYLQLDCPECARSTNKELQERIINTLHAASVEEQKALLCKFLVAATAKDCSMMVTLKIVDADYAASTTKNIISCPETGKSYIYKISFLDLDLKRLKKMPHYLRLDQSIVKHFIEISKHKEST